MDNKFEVVVARYNEDLNWLFKEFPNDKVTIYNKGQDLNIKLPDNYKIIKLPNIGRESHTYLYHIIHEYDNLNDKILFLQGNPYDQPQTIFQPLSVYKYRNPDSCTNITARCAKDNLKNLNNYLQKVNWSKTKWKDTALDQGTMTEYLERHLHKDLHQKELNIIYNSQFAVKKGIIHNRNKKHYNNLLSTVATPEPIAGHYLERLWDVVFDINYY
jgi:hypothetical protein